MIPIKIINGELRKEQIEAIKEKAESIKGCVEIVVEISGGYADIYYYIQPFQRIRRITGYLVGTMDRWNDAKRCEEHDRVKHTVSAGPDPATPTIGDDGNGFFNAR